MGPDTDGEALLVGGGVGENVVLKAGPQLLALVETGRLGAAAALVKWNVASLVGVGVQFGVGNPGPARPNVVLALICRYRVERVGRP